MTKYTLITPEMIWTAPNADKFVPLQPSGCSFIDVLATKIRRHGNAPARFYAKYMDADYLYFCHTVQTLTGMTANRWINQLVMMDNEWLLMNTFLTVSEIARRQGYPHCTNFCRAWKSHYRLSPDDYRTRNRDVVKRVVREIKLL